MFAKNDRVASGFPSLAPSQNPHSPYGCVNIASCVTCFKGMRRLRPIDFTISARGKATSGPDVSS
ncbi:hypothetical protein, partial [Agrobacterium tumefaciens]|uniref:hypothetical protein n=1 Tax=Agrobacterium tumefaciens TaxID=358 RepID=UPI001AEC262F